MTFIGRTPWLQPDWRVYLPRLHALLEAPEQIGFGDNSDLKCQTSGDLDPSGHINVFDMSVRMSNISDIPNCTSWVNQNYKCIECFHTPLNLIHPTLVFFDAFLMLHGQPSRNRALTANRPGPGRITVSNGAPFGKCFSGPKIQDSPGLHCLFLGIKFGCPKCFFVFLLLNCWKENTAAWWSLSLPLMWKSEKVEAKKQLSLRPVGYRFIPYQSSHNIDYW